MHKNNRDIATFILTSLNKVFPKPKRPCSRHPDPKSLIIPTNPMTIDYFEIQIDKGNAYYRDFYSSHASFQDKAVLDIGCGLGGGTFAYSKAGVRLALGLEIETAYLVSANKYIQEKYGSSDRLVFLGGDATSIPLKSDSFDLVIANDFIEHVSYPQKAFQEVFRVLKEGGYFFFEFPAYYSPRGSHMHYSLYMPWCHVFFSEDTLVKAAKIIAAKENSFWVFNPGWEERYHTGLNKITIRHFLNILLTQKNCQLVDLYFQSEYKLLQPLVYLGKLKEYFASVRCILRKNQKSCVQMRDIKKSMYRGIKKDWDRLKNYLHRLYSLKKTPR